MYKAQYYVDNADEIGWKDVEAYTIGGEGPTLLLKDKQEAIDLASARHNVRGDNVRVLKWNRTKLKWEQIKIKF